jgi:hypothetical protein
MIDLGKIISWLGPKGAIAGLIESNLTIPDLIELGPDLNLRAHSKLKRDDLITRLVINKRRQMTKSPEELMQMDSNALMDYFLELKFSRDEILEILDSLEIRPGSVALKNLTAFAAREISEIGMYRRVAHGRENVENGEIESSGPKDLQKSSFNRN